MTYRRTVGDGVARCPRMTMGRLCGSVGKMKPVSRRAEEQQLCLVTATLGLWLQAGPGKKLTKQ